jgi:hypothetical protein
MAKPESHDDALANGLKAAKSKRMYFAAVLKGGADGALIVSKTKVSPADIAEAKKKCGGSSVINGICFGEDGRHVFETAKSAPATLAQALKTIAKRDANLSIIPICRIGGGPDLEDRDAPAAPATPAQAAAKPARAPATPAPATPAAGTSPAGTSAAGTSAAAAAPVPATSGNAESMLQWRRRMNSLTDDLKQVQTANPQLFPKIQAEVLKARRFRESNDFIRANATLDMVDKLIAKLLTKSGAGEAAPAGPVEATKFTAALATWNRTVKEVFNDLGRLESRIRSAYPQESTTASQLKTILRRFPKNLATTLQAGSQAKDPDALASNRAKALQTIRNFRATIASDPLVKVVDKCPFERIDLSTKLSSALTELQSQLSD